MSKNKLKSIWHNMSINLRLRVSKEKDCKIFLKKWNILILIIINLLRTSMMNWKWMIRKFQPQMRRKQLLLQRKSWKRASTKRRFQLKILKTSQFRKRKKRHSLTRKNQLLKNQRRNRICIKDIGEFTLPNKETMKLLIMVDIRSCTNVITKRTVIREEVEELCRLMTSWVQTAVLKMDLSTNDLQHD